MSKDVLQKGILFFASVFLFFASWSQGRTVTGTILDDKDSPLSGATVSVKNTKISTSTNALGAFTISVPESNRTLVISYVGMQSREIALGSRNTVSVSMTAVLNTLNDVVVIGYGKAKRANLTSAQTSVSAKDIDRTVNTTVEQAIQGRAAGVYVTQNSGAPGGGMSINIRGVSSVNGQTEPLYVIDGVQIEASRVSYGEQSSSNALAGLNPSDIDNIQILQGPSATSLYGSRGTNGVVLITTKRGKSGEAKLTYGFQHSEQTPPPSVELMDLRQYAQMVNEFGALAPRTVPQEFLDPSLLGKGTDWQKELFKNAPMDKHSISLSGGSEKTNYFVSGEYLKQDGIALGSGFNRYSFRVNLDNKPRDWINVGVNLSFNQTNENLTTGNEEIISKALQLTPQVPVKNADGSWAGGDIYNGAVQYAPVNPIALASLTTNRNKRNQFLGGLNVSINIIKGLTLTTSYNTNVNFFNSDYYVPKYKIGYAENATAKLKEGSGTETSWVWNQLLEYNRQFGKHNINIVASHESQQRDYKNLGGSKTGFLTNDILDLQAGDDKTAGATGGSGIKTIESYLSRVTYNFDNRYILVGAIRRDGSSFFGPNNRWGTFPSVSAAWRISQEHFFNVPFISDLKLRLETGTTGNTYWQQGYYSPLSASATPSGTGFLSGRLPNPDTKWEQTQTNNIGLNVGVLKDRIQFEFDYYLKKTNNLLMQAILPSYLGTNGNGSAGAPLVNDGNLNNKGWSFTINTTNINTKKFKWESNLNLSAFKTTVTKFNQDRPYIERTSWWLGGWTQRASIGSAPWLFRGYIEDGLFQSVEEINKSAVPVDGNGQRLPTNEQTGIWVGDVKFKDISGPQGVPDGKIDIYDQTNIGNPWPKLFAGFTNSFSYGGFDLSILLTATYGNDIYNYFAKNVTNPNNINLGWNLPIHATEYARPIVKDDGSVGLANPGTNVARISYGPNGNYTRFTNKFVEDGSFIRLKNISLSYSIPNSLISRQKAVKGIRATIGVQNIYTFTHYSGYDPEVGSYVDRNSGPDNQAVGLDNGRYPLTPIYTFNLGLNF